MYNDRAAAEVTALPARPSCDAVALRETLVGRAVLLDFPRAQGVDWLPDGHAIDIERARRGGRVRRHRDPRGRHRPRCAPACSPAAGSRAGGCTRAATPPGLSFYSLPWLAEHGVAAVASDTWGVEVRPNELPDSFQPFHIPAVVYMGLLLGEMFDFEALAEACAEAGPLRGLLLGAADRRHRRLRRPSRPGRGPLPWPPTPPTRGRHVRGPRRRRRARARASLPRRRPAHQPHRTGDRQRLRLRARREFPIHIHPEEQITVVLEGTVVFEVEGEPHELGTGRDLRGRRPTSSTASAPAPTDARFLAVVVPRRSRLRRLRDQRRAVRDEHQFGQPGHRRAGRHLRRSDAGADRGGARARSEETFERVAQATGRRARRALRRAGQDPARELRGAGRPGHLGDGQDPCRVEGRSGEVRDLLRLHRRARPGAAGAADDRGRQRRELRPLRAPRGDPRGDALELPLRAGLPLRPGGDHRGQRRDAEARLERAPVRDRDRADVRRGGLPRRRLPDPAGRARRGRGRSSPTAASAASP